MVSATCLSTMSLRNLTRTARVLSSTRYGDLCVLVVANVADCSCGFLTH